MVVIPVGLSRCFRLEQMKVDHDKQLGDYSNFLLRAMDMVVDHKSQITVQQTASNHFTFALT